ncbi:putative cytosolic Cu/Zn superoxide dismutase [Aspergillus undulatus]|uniref:putative cytosolic Cu/Zn superoxide dismutase n=1 Tax=Aspergillus undulatus TaxID=1810928 RepID=UPI003CCD2927
MRLTLLTSAILGLSTTALAQTNTSTHAPVVTDNEPYSVHHATLLPKDNTTVYGTITITARASSPALHVDVVIGGIPEGEYLNYHIHAKPIPSDSESNDNCYRTAAHLDPYNRGQTPPCNITAPWTCEVGDLSGKHGPAWAPPGGVFRASYDDFFLSNTPGSDAYFGDLSWVVHAPNSDRLSCGNFEYQYDESDKVTGSRITRDG